MKHKTAELTGALLDAAVAMAEGKEVCIGTDEGRLTVACMHAGPLRYSTDWRAAGPIIEREEIDLIHYGREAAPSLWECAAEVHAGFRQYGPTPLIAAMRAYVASKLGDEVDLP